MKQRREDRKQVGFLTTGYSGLNVRESLPRTRPVTRILCGRGGGGGANKAKVDQTTEMYFLLSDPFI